MHLTPCGDNVFAYREGKNCSTGVLRFVDPETGAIYDPATRSSTVEPVRWELSNSAILASMSAASRSTSVTSTQTSTSTGASSTLLAPTESPASREASSTSLPAGAGAGIGIGCAAAFAVMGLLAWSYIRERRKRQALLAFPNPPMYQPEPSPKAVFAHS